jgi:hypothetical protein
VGFIASLLAYLGSVAGILLGLVTLFSVLLAPTVQPAPIHRVAVARIRPAQSATGRHKQSLSTSHAESDSAPQAVRGRYQRERRRVAHAYSRRQKPYQAVSPDRVNEWAHGRDQYDLAHRNSYAQELSYAHRFW